MNYAQLGSDIGISQSTVKSWCSVLEASHVAAPLRPWFGTMGKRLAKSPKWYLTDSGLAAYLIGCTSPAHLATHPHRGHLFEGFVVTEAMKVLAHNASPARLHIFAAPTSGVDLLVEAKGRTLAIEIKAGMTIASDWFKTPARVAAIPELAVEATMIVYGGDDEQRRSQADVCPWWLFPVRLGAWLATHDALSSPVDLTALEARLRRCCGPASAR